MRYLLTFLLLVLFAFAHAQNVTKPLPSCIKLKTGCNGLGVCQENGACRCYPGFTFPTLIINGTATRSRVYCNGSKSHLFEKRELKNTAVLDGGSYMRPLVIALRTEISIFNFILFGLIVYRLVLDFKLYGKRRDIITKVSLGFIATSTLLLFINNVLDYWGVYGVMAPMAFFAFHAIIEWLLVGVFCAIVLHWVNIYNSTVKSIRRQEMIMKINSNYAASVSVEEVVQSVTFLKIFRLPYIAITGITLCITIARLFTTPLATSVDGYGGFYRFFNAWFLILWFLFGVAFAIYGYKLQRVMPPASSHKIKRVTGKLCLMALICTINALCMILLDNYTPVFPSLPGNIGLITRNYITFNTRTMVAAVVLDIYMPFSKMKYWLNGSLFSSHTTDASKGGTQVEAAVNRSNQEEGETV
ncbi:hypothetical protein PROFUN_02491 [Planoprotostelium fungivorum]|uniref:THH1/TOM1/TOM3 domain-containing protein n=1 Tax=Planoprotostelium fungivorum TaxID=1890364 RepID=A0A2P6MP69_9EUKA|nr:hypothetical protein PROFUN_02491 [Planoprotostelium fungivorum]